MKEGYINPFLKQGPQTPRLRSIKKIRMFKLKHIQTPKAIKCQGLLESAATKFNARYQAGLFIKLMCKANKLLFHWERDFGNWS